MSTYTTSTHRRTRSVRRDPLALDVTTRGLPRQPHTPAQHRPSTTIRPMRSLRRVLRRHF